MSTCGVPICQCITPPALTCIQRQCPSPVNVVVPEDPHILPIDQDQVVVTNGRDNKLPCPVPGCAPNCKIAVNPESGCPMCDCDSSNQNGFIVELAIVDEPVVEDTRSNIKGK